MEVETESSSARVSNVL